MPTDFGFAVGTGRDGGHGNVMWNVNVMLMPFHKVISSIPMAAHVWAPIDDENTMLYSVDFNGDRPLTEQDLARTRAWRGIHTENIPGTDIAIRNKGNDYLIDRALQASGQNFTGMKGLGTQDCAVQESMGPIADRTKEHLLLSDMIVVRLRRLLLQTLEDMKAGKPLPGMAASSYRVRSTRYEAPVGVAISNDMAQLVRQHVRSAAE